MAAPNVLTSRNLFEVDNARNMSTSEVVQTFLPTRSFWRLLSTKNHIVCGARGSGKTVLMKMLGHDHLSRLEHQTARRIVSERQFIGIYVPTKIEWVSALKNKPWKTEEEAELFFQWRLNVATCIRFLVSLRSCLRLYHADEIERARHEVTLARAISRSWSDNNYCGNTLQEIERYLSDLEYRMQTQLARKRVIGNLREGEEFAGLTFFTDLFVPLRRAISIASDVLAFESSTSWLLCLDEAEFLEEFQQRILNAHLRAESGNLFFKISTMPYYHKTVATNTGAALSVGHDFEYVYIDRDLIHFSPSGDDAGEEAALRILERRGVHQNQAIGRDTWMHVLGPSPLMDAAPAEWQQDSRTMRLIEKYGDDALIERARKLVGRKEFRDQIARKVKPALLLREVVSRTKGNRPLDLYCGMRLAIRCSDANPRRLIRIFNLLMHRAIQPDGTLKRISPNNQTTLLSQFSESVLNRTLSHPRVGKRVLEILSAIGWYAHDQLHNHRLRSDQTSGIQVDESISAEDWEAIKAAVGIGLLFPQTTPSRGDPMPEKEGAFHLGYVLAPHFRILPRRGRPKRFAIAVAFWNNEGSSVSRKNNSSPQMDFRLEPKDE
ncbi:MAG TPA: hypothetical protein VGG45_20330 [Terracidiphilus sp.]